MEVKEEVKISSGGNGLWFVQDGREKWMRRRRRRRKVVVRKIWRRVSGKRKINDCRKWWKKCGCGREREGKGKINEGKH